MLSINLQSRIFTEYHAGKEFTTGTRYRYTLQYNPLALLHTWVIRQAKSGGAWEWVQPLAPDLQFRERTKGGECLMYFVLLVLLLPFQILIEILKLNK